MAERSVSDMAASMENGFDMKGTVLSWNDAETGHMEKLRASVAVHKDNQVLGEAPQSTPQHSTNKMTLKQKIVHEQKAEDEAVANEVEAEEVLGKAAESGGAKDYNSAQVVMHEIRRKSALETMVNFGYECTRKEMTSPKEAAEAAAAVMAATNDTATNATAKKANQTAANKTEARELSSVMSLVETMEEVGSATELGEAMPTTPDGAEQALKLDDANKATQDALSQLEAMNKAVAEMKQRLKEATDKIQKVKFRAAKSAAATVQQTKSAMQEMKEQLQQYQNVVRAATNRFAETKVKDAQGFATIMKERYYKSRGMTKVEETKLEKAREKHKVLSEKALEAGKRVAELKVQLEAMQVKETATKGEEIFATTADKNFAKFQAEATEENMKAYQRQIDLAKETEEGYKQDVEAQKREIKNALENHLKAKQEQKAAQDKKNDALEELVKQKKRSAQLVNTPLPTPESLPTPSQQADAIERDRLKEEAKLEHQQKINDAEKQLARAADSGKARDLAIAQGELDTLNGKTPIGSQGGECGFLTRKCSSNGAKCKGEKNQGAGEAGSLECSMPEDMRCYDSLTSAGIFVPVASPGIGFCAPWLSGHVMNATYDDAPSSENSVLEAALMGGRTYVKAGLHQSKTNPKLGVTYVVKLGGFHPDGASRKVGMLAFKRVVCKGGNCEEFKGSKCFVCDREIFTSDLTARTTIADNVQFMKECALPILQKNNEEVPEGHQCKDADLISATRAMLAW